MDTDAIERQKTNIFAGVSSLREKEVKQTPEEAARRKQMQDYLKKYEGDGGERQNKKKRKKKKRPEATAGAIQIIDNDLTGFSNAPEEPEPKRIDEDEFAPVIANVEEAERAMSSVDEASPPRRASPCHDSDDDASPPRRGVRRHDSDDDASPPRRGVRRHDSDDDASPPRRGAPRHDSDDDASPPRRGASRHDSDSDASPPRRKVARHDSNDDASPPRRPGGREGGDEDASPPRRPAGRAVLGRRAVPDGSDNDASPPRRPVVARENDSDASPPRRGSDGKAPAVGGSSAARRPASMADGTKAGLVEASEITREMKKKAEAEEKKWREMGRERTGKGVETVYRDKRGQRTSKEEYEEGKRKARHRSRWEEEPITWKQGLAQQRAQQLLQQRIATEGSKPFAAGYDEELNREQQEELRADDPMLQFVRKAQRVEDLAPSLLAGPNADLLRKSGFVIPQEVPPHSWLRRGAIAPQNRFSIKPGRHWDGVDRSTGFEKGLFVQMNQKVAAAKEARKYAMEADDL